MKKRIDPAQRRHQDYLRRKTLKTARYYDGRLCSLRSSNVKGVLSECRDYPPDQWEDVISLRLTEPYLGEWYGQLYLATGLPQIRSTVRDMNRAKAEDSGIWESAVLSYARERAGEQIVSVTGTLRKTLVSILRRELEESDGMGVEAITQRIFRSYRQQQEWEVRRIVQTEALISAGRAGDIASRSLEIPFVKQWCVSGLANTRDTHLAADGTLADADEPFTVGKSLLMYPHDTSMGADASEIVNCACSCIRRPK